MQFSKSILLSVLSALTISAAPIEKRSNPPRLDFEVKKVNGTGFNSTTKAKFRSVKSAASSGITVSLENEYSLYLAKISIGTPAQNIEVDIDTGSSDLWVPGAGTQSDSGTYDHTASSTYHHVKGGFQISYGDGSSASGDWATETINIGGADVTNLEFGDATTQDVGQSILGVGLKGNEASAVGYSSFTYDNLPLKMKDEGLISKAAYSLWLNSEDASAGSILFGAIDNAKYSGDLAYLPLVNIDDEGDQTSLAVAFFVNLQGISAGSKTFTSSAYPALLDSGTSLIYAPSHVASAIGRKYGTYSSSVGGYVTSCSSSGPDFTFKFNGKTIKVPFSNILYGLNGSGSSQCLVGVLDSGDDSYILGDTFLRSAYVYYDIDDAKIGIAQASYSGSSDIQLV